MNQWKFPPDTYNPLSPVLMVPNVLRSITARSPQTIEIHLAGYIRFQKVPYLLLIVTQYLPKYHHQPLGCLYHIIFTDAQPPGLHRFVIRLHHHRHVPHSLRALATSITTSRHKCQFRQELMPSSGPQKRASIKACGTVFNSNGLPAKDIGNCFPTVSRSIACNSRAFSGE